MGVDVFLLRNESRGRGMGFFEAENFYPDFILWLVEGKKQSLSFIEPHGLQHEGPDSRKSPFTRQSGELRCELATRIFLLIVSSLRQHDTLSSTGASLFHNLTLGMYFSWKTNPKNMFLLYLKTF